jgi:hypothetical protein
MTFLIDIQNLKSLLQVITDKNLKYGEMTIFSADKSFKITITSYYKKNYNLHGDNIFLSLTKLLK